MCGALYLHDVLKPNVCPRSRCILPSTLFYICACLVLKMPQREYMYPMGLCNLNLVSSDTSEVVDVGSECSVVFRSHISPMFLLVKFISPAPNVTDMYAPLDCWIRSLKGKTYVVDSGVHAVLSPVRSHVFFPYLKTVFFPFISEIYFTSVSLLSFAYSQ